MINASIALFALAAVLGLTILINWLTKKEASRTVIYAHGLIAATALVRLTLYSLKHPESFPKISLIVFVLGALGVFYLFFTDLQKKPHSIAIAFA